MSKCSNNVANIDTVDVSQLFFTNLSLLGFDSAAMERKHRIPFNKDMFLLPNKKGFETAMYFLFNRLDPARCKDHFRDCWPITDKKEEQQFRKMCTTWLEQIAKDDPNAYLPRIGASLFMSPGGEKFIQFMFCFSRYVLYRSAISEHGARCPVDFQAHPLITPQNSSMALTIAKVTAAGATLLIEKFLSLCTQLETLQMEWVLFCDELVKEYRSLVKCNRDLERQIKADMMKVMDRSSSDVSPSRQKRSSAATEYDHEIQAVQRTQAVQRVRSMWKSFEEFYSGLSENREIVESILHRTVEKYQLDATEHTLRLPDLLLRECEQEIHRRNVDDVYKEGKINLLSLVHLSNLALHIYIEKMHEVGLPDLDEFLPEVSSMLQTHRSHLSNAESYRSHLEFELLPEMKQSVESLKAQRDEKFTCYQTPTAFRITSLGLGLEPPTPPVSFEPQDDEPPGSMQHIDQSVRQHHSFVSTPDAASQLLEDVENKIRSKHSSSLVQGSPLYGPRDLMKSKDVPRMPAKMYMKNTPPEKLKVHAKETKPAGQTKTVPVKGSHVKPTSLLQAKAVTAPVTQANMSFPKRTVDSRTPIRMQKPNVSVERHWNDVSSDITNRNHLDVLANKVANMMLSDSPEQQDTSPGLVFDPADEIGLVMFRAADKIQRTPPMASSTHAVGGTWHEVLTASGPLSSTHIDTGSERSSPANQRHSNDNGPVAVRLFTSSDAFEPGERGIKTFETLDDEELPSSTTPSSIHSVHSANSSSGSHSGESSVLESISGRIQSRVLDDGSRRMTPARTLAAVTNDLMFDEPPASVAGNRDTLGFSEACFVDATPRIIGSAGFESGGQHRDIATLNCLDETLRSLLETKTPMLPSRKLRLDSSTGVPHSVHDNGQWTVNRDRGQTFGGCLDGIPAKNSANGHHKQSHTDETISHHQQIVRSNNDEIAVRSLSVSDNCRSLDVGVTSGSRSEFANRTKFHPYSPVPSSRVTTENIPSFRSESCDASMTVAYKTSGPDNIPQHPTRRTDHSSPINVYASTDDRNLSTCEQIVTNIADVPLSSSSDVDHLIARYQTLRRTSERQLASDHSATDIQTSSHPISFPPVCWPDQRSSAVDIASGQHSAVVERRQESTDECNDVSELCQAVKYNSHHAPAENERLSSSFHQPAERPIGDMSFECGLDNDDFDDIRQNLMDVSVGSGVTPVIQRLNKKDSSFLDVSRTSFHSMPMSPLTDLLHHTGDVRSSLVNPTAFEISTRLSTSLVDDILREDGSLLVPSSPADNIRTQTPVQTASLIDFT